MSDIKELPLARIEFTYSATAFCPNCDAEHDVSTCGEGTEVCVCGTSFDWATVD